MTAVSISSSSNPFNLFTSLKYVHCRRSVNLTTESGEKSEMALHSETIENFIESHIFQYAPEEFFHLTKTYSFRNRIIQSNYVEIFEDKKERLGRKINELEKAIDPLKKEQRELEAKQASSAISFEVHKIRERRTTLDKITTLSSQISTIQTKITPLAEELEALKSKMEKIKNNIKAINNKSGLEDLYRKFKLTPKRDRGLSVKDKEKE